MQYIRTPHIPRHPHPLRAIDSNKLAPDATDHGNAADEEERNQDDDTEGRQDDDDEDGGEDDEEGIQ